MILALADSSTTYCTLPKQEPYGVVTSYQYCPPEVLLSSPTSYDNSCDIWLGVILAEMLRVQLSELPAGTRLDRARQTA